MYELVTPFWRYNTRKYSLGESILLVKTKEYTLLYIPDKFLLGRGFKSRVNQYILYFINL